MAEAGTAGSLSGAARTRDRPGAAMTPVSIPPAPSRAATRMLAVLSAAFMASRFFRVSNVVIAPELMRRGRMKRIRANGYGFCARGVAEVSPGGPQPPPFAARNCTR